jgi:hypothetical protein
MQQSHEARFFDLDLESVRRRLHSLRATCVSPRRLVRGVILENERTRERGTWVSVRTDGATHVLGLSRSGEGAELEVTVSDFSAVREVLEELGLAVTRHQESHREEWRLHGITCVLDEWPGLPPSLEITGSDVAAVQWAARRLGLDPAQAVPEQSVPEPPEDREPFEIAEVGWSSYHSDWEPGTFVVRWTAVLQNPHDKHYCEYPTIQITARNETGQVVGTDDHVMHVFPPGARIAWASSLETNGPPHSLEITARPAAWQATATRPAQFPPFGYQGIRFIVRGRSCSVTGEVTNPYPVYVDQIAITALFRDQRGRLVGGETTFVEGLAAHGTVPFKLDGEAPAQSGAVASLDLVTIPWTSGSEDPWDVVLGRV